MKKAWLLPVTLLWLFVTFNMACKKSKSGTPAGETSITTIELESESTTAVYGRKYTFKVRFDKVGDVAEYGVVYKGWIGNLTNKIPELGTADSYQVPFRTEPSAGTVLTEQITLPFSNFNDANYRAYAKLSDGSVVYGEVLYIIFA